MNNMLSDIQIMGIQAPEYVMPEWVHPYVFIAVVVAVVVMLLLAIRMSLKYKKPMPILLVIASALTCFVMEALVCSLGHATHAQIGQDTLYTAYGRMIPTYLFFAYVLYFGSWYLYMYPQMIERKINGSTLWKLYIACILFAYFLEIPGISTGMWVYYEPQPFYIWKATLPPTWAFFNAFAVVFAVVAIDKILPVLTGWKQPLILVCVPIVAPLGSIAGGMPFYWTMNAGLTQRGIDLGGVATIAMCLFGVWLLIQLGYREYLPMQREKNKCV